MRPFLALLTDSFREASDRRDVLLLLILAGAIVLFCFGISFDKESPLEVLDRQARELGAVRHGLPTLFGGARGTVRTRTDYTVVDVRPVVEEEWPEALRGGGTVELAFPGRESLESLGTFLERHEQRFEQGPREGGAGEALRFGPGDSGAGAWRGTLTRQFHRLGYNHVEIREIRHDPPLLRAAVRADQPWQVRSAHRIHLLFGLWSRPLATTSVAEVVLGIQLALANVFAGFLGMLIAVLSCSTFVPAMLQKGTVDLVLARPLGRGRLLLFKYLGAVFFVSVLAALLIGGCWLAFTVRTSHSSLWFLATVLTVTLVFAVLHSVSVLVGVVTRSGSIAGLLAIGVWAMCGSVANMHRSVEAGTLHVPAVLRRGIGVFHAVLPKITDLGHLNAVFLSRSHLAPEAVRAILPAEVAKADWTFVFFTTALFTAVMLAGAAWALRKRDL